ncbi:divergent protein kinase domain 2A-like [Styela clava]
MIKQKMHFVHARRFMILQTRDAFYKIEKMVNREKCTAYMSLSLFLSILFIIFVSRIHVASKDTTTFPSDSQFTSTGECGQFPCMGKTMCDDIYDGFLKIDKTTPPWKYKSWTIFRGVLVNRHLEFRRKNCTIRLLESESVKYDTNNMDIGGSLGAFRTTVCQNLLGENKCRINDTIHDWPILKRILRSKGILKAELIRDFSPPLKCATQRLVNRIVRRTSSKRNGRMTLQDLTYADKASLLFKLRFATGSWMQDAFPSNEGWPFGLTYGTCGRIAIHAEMGTMTLAEAHNLPWKLRLDLAAQLMEMALQLLHSDDKYLFLIDKLSLNDFVISREGKLKIVNSDDVTVIDIAESKPNNEDVNDDCKNVRHDLNIVFVCGILFSKNNSIGLLHDPEESVAFVSLLTALLDVCSNRSPMPGSKFFAGDNIDMAKNINKLFLSVRPCSEEVPYRFPECQSMDESGEIYHIPWQEVA